MKKSITVAALGLLMLGACKVGDKVASNNTKQMTRVASCGDIPIDLAKPHIDWYKESRSVLNTNSTDNVMVLPKEYEVYSLNKTQIETFFAASAAGEQLNLVVPLAYPVGCKSFPMKNDGGTPQQLKSIDRQYTLKVVYDGKALSGFAVVDDETYRIMPVQNNNAWYCVVYKQAKQPANDNKATPQGQVLQQRFDK